MATTTSEKAPRILGLTGPIACGKTTVGDILLRLGALVRIDADRVVHQLMAPGTETTRAIAAVFGADILAPDGSVDRVRLGELVFADSERLRALEAIVHPAVRERIRELLQELDGQKGIVVVDAVRLLQSELLPLCDAVWVVTCPPEVQFQRLVQLRGMSENAARMRMAAAPSFDHPRVTSVIENPESLQELEDRVWVAWKRLQRRNG